MLLLMLSYLQVPATTEPLLMGGAVVGIGGVILWFANVVIEARDGMRSLLQTLHGPKDNPSTGLVARFEVHYKEMTSALGVLSMETVTLDKRMTRVEDRCEITHPKE